MLIMEDTETSKIHVVQISRILVGEKENEQIKQFQLMINLLNKINKVTR